jgi:Tfp pilus assembly protein PilF
MFDSALNRYEMSYKKFSGFGLDARSVVGAIRSARELNDTQKEKRYLEILNAKFGDSSEAKLLKSGGPVE